MWAGFNGSDEQLVIGVLEAAGVGVTMDVVLLPTARQQGMQHHPGQGGRAFQCGVLFHVLDAFDGTVLLLQAAQYPVQGRVVVIAAIDLLQNFLALHTLECAQQELLKLQLYAERFVASRPQLHLHLATGLDLRVVIRCGEQLGVATFYAHQQELTVLALPLQIQCFAVLRDDARRQQLYEWPLIHGDTPVQVFGLAVALPGADCLAVIDRCSRVVADGAYDQQYPLGPGIRPGWVLRHAFGLDRFQDLEHFFAKLIVGLDCVAAWRGRFAEDFLPPTREFDGELRVIFVARHPASLGLDGLTCTQLLPLLVAEHHRRAIGQREHTVVGYLCGAGDDPGETPGPAIAQASFVGSQRRVVQGQVAYRPQAVQALQGGDWVVGMEQPAALVHTGAVLVAGVEHLGVVGVAVVFAQETDFLVLPHGGRRGELDCLCPVPEVGGVEGTDMAHGQCGTVPGAFRIGQVQVVHAVFDRPHPGNLGVADVHRPDGVFTTLRHTGSNPVAFVMRGPVKAEYQLAVQVSYVDLHAGNL